MSSEQWKTVVFSDTLSEKVRNGLYKSKEFHGRGVKIINMGELFQNPKLSTNIEMKYIDVSSDELSRFSVIKGDLLFARRSLTADGAGKCIYVSSGDQPCVFESSLIRARINSNAYSSEYLYYYFNSPLGKSSLGSILRQVAVSGITGTDLMNLEMRLPPLPIQHRIAAILSAFDDKIELNRQMNRTLEQMARALFQSWFVDFDPVRAKMRGKTPEGMDAATAALFPDELIQVDGKEVPKGWSVSTVGDVFTLYGGSTPSTSNPEFWEQGEYHWTTPKDMSGLEVPFLTKTERKITRLGVEKITSGVLPIGTVLLSSRAPVGYLAIAAMPVSINQGYIALDSTGVFGKYFILNFLQSQLEEIKGIASGTTFIELSKKVFRYFKLVVPNQNIADAYEAQVDDLYSQIKTNIYESAYLTQLRDSLLPRLLSGEVDMGDWKELA